MHDELDRQAARLTELGYPSGSRRTSTGCTPCSTTYPLTVEPATPCCSW